MSKQQKATSIKQFGVARPIIPAPTPAVPPARLPERDKPCYNEQFSYVNCKPVCCYKRGSEPLPGCPFFVDRKRRLGDGWNARLPKPAAENEEVA